MVRISFGAVVKDSVTGFKGTVVARAEFITGCVQYEVVPSVDKDGKMTDSYWIDENRLEIVRAAKKVIAKKATGGPQNRPPSASRRA